MTTQEVVLIEALVSDAIADLKRGAITAFNVELDAQLITFTLTKASPLLGDKKPYAKGLIQRKEVPATVKLSFIQKQAHMYYRDSIKNQLEVTFLTALREQNVLMHPDEAKLIIRPNGGSQ